jgi:hypothetical protein
MTYTVHSSRVRTIKNNDPLYFIHDQFVITPRAGIEIDSRCPGEHKWIIQQCIENGWLKPVAHVTEQEYMWMSLSKE